MLGVLGGCVCGIMYESDGGGWGWVVQVPEMLVRRGPVMRSLCLLLIAVVVIVVVGGKHFLTTSYMPYTVPHPLYGSSC